MISPETQRRIYPSLLLPLPSQIVAAEASVFNLTVPERRMMPILHLDKMIFHSTREGINCRACGGQLERQKGKSLLTWVLMICTLGLRKMDQFRCRNCHKEFTVL